MDPSRLEVGLGPSTTLASQPHKDIMEVMGMEAKEGSLGGAMRGPVPQTGLSGSDPFLESLTEGRRDSSSGDMGRALVLG